MTDRPLPVTAIRHGRDRTTRTAAAAVAAVAAATLTLAGCAASPSAPRPEQPQEPVHTTAANPRPDAGSVHQLLGDDLRLVPGTRLASPIGRTQSGTVTGWYALLTVSRTATLDAALANFGRQLSHRGYRVSADSAGLHAYRPADVVAPTAPPTGAAATPGGATSSTPGSGSVEPGGPGVGPAGTYVDVLRAPGTAQLAAHVQVIVMTTA